MEELMSIAKAYYQACPDEVQTSALAFFKEMDRDGNGTIDCFEFMEFMIEEGLADMRMNSPEFFDKIDMDGSGNLDFWEVMTLYYIIRSRRPFCDFCSAFIMGTYFVCIQCFQSTTGGTFHLCLGCHLSAKCGHNHSGDSSFLDNYTLLEAYKTSAMNQPRPPPMQRSQSSIAVVRNSSGRNPNYAPPSSSSTSNAIVPARRSTTNFRPWKAAFKTFEISLSIANLGVGLTQLGACSIM